MQFVEVSWPRFLAGVDDVEQHRCFRGRSQGLGLERELAVGIGVARLEESVEQRVMRLATMAAENGLDGVVCSALEAPALRTNLDKDFCLVTPGIRLAGDSAGDQRRIVTPAMAVSSGSDYLVIGRSITGAADPLHALQRVRQELNLPL